MPRDSLSGVHAHGHCCYRRLRNEPPPAIPPVWKTSVNLYTCLFVLLFFARPNQVLDFVGGEIICDSGQTVIPAT